MFLTLQQGVSTCILREKDISRCLLLSELIQLFPTSINDNILVPEDLGSIIDLSSFFLYCASQEEKKIYTDKELQKQLRLGHFLECNDYIRYLCWNYLRDRNGKDVLSILSSLPLLLQEEMYLYLSLNLIPEEVRTNKGKDFSFIQEWLMTNINNLVFGEYIYITVSRNDLVSMYKGEIDGIRYFWSDNGTPWLRENYVNGEKEGIQEYWSGSNLWRIEFFQRGKREGKQYQLYPSGKLRKRNNFKNDHLDGEQIFISEDGEICRIEIFSEGNYVTDNHFCSDKDCFWFLWGSESPCSICLRLPELIKEIKTEEEELFSLHKYGYRV